MKKYKKNKNIMIYKKLRNNLLKNITNNLGEIKETEDEIICYVDNKKLKKYKKGTYLPIYKLILLSKNIYSKNILDKYNINKPINYVINNMDFETALILSTSEDTNVTFSNCKFNREFVISSAGEITLENNEYCDEENIYLNRQSFCRIFAKKLKFVNDNFINRSNYKTQTKFGIMIDTENLEIINSRFDIKKNDGVISIRSNNVSFNNCDIECYNSLYINADEISNFDTMIKSETEINIKNKNNNKIMSINSPKTIYNDIDVSKQSYITPSNIELQKSRILLVEKLREVRDYFVNIKLSKLNELENELNQTTLTKIIK